MIGGNNSFNNEAFKDHEFYFNGYKYKLQLDYITPFRSESDLKWFIKIDGVENEITINKIGSLTDKTILETLKYNLEEPCEITNSHSFAVNILSNIEKLTEKYSENQ